MFTNYKKKTYDNFHVLFALDESVQTWNMIPLSSQTWTEPASPVAIQDSS